MLFILKSTLGSKKVQIIILHAQEEDEGWNPGGLLLDVVVA